MTRWTPLADELLPGALASWLAAVPGTVRVAVDGPPSAGPDELAARLVEPLRALGRPAVQVRADHFWRDASLRLEYGREDIDSYRAWLDAEALQREVLGPAVAEARYLPGLRDPATNRSTHEPARPLEPRSLVLVSGQFLLGRGLAFDRVVHLLLPGDARERLTPPADIWTLPAFDDYDAEVRPADLADVVVRPDRRPPIVRGLAG